MHRRDFLKAALATTTLATIIRPAVSSVIPGGSMPWKTTMEDLPKPVAGASLKFLDTAQAKLVSAIFDRLLPEDEISMSATQAGCVTFIDAQLDGPFGKAESRYQLGPFKKGTPQQGYQSPLTPADYYKRGLATLEDYCQAQFSKSFTGLTDAEKDHLIEQMENDEIKFSDADISARTFFELLLQNVKEGYFADPIYGGNKDMVGWKMVGFPGAVYDYRPYLAQTGKPMNIEPISLLGRKVNR